MSDVGSSETQEAKTHFREIFQKRRGVKRLTRKEEGAGERGIKGKVWNRYGDEPYDKVLDYQLSLEDALVPLGIDSLRGYLTQRKERGLTTNILDLMGGDPSFLRGLVEPTSNNGENVQVLDRGLATGLADDRTTEIKDADTKAGIDVLCGDLMAKRIWSEIDLWQRDNGIKSFDLIVCRPVDGIWEIAPVLYPYIFGKVWERLSDNGGLFVTQFSKDITRDQMRDFKYKLSKEYPGMKHYVSEDQVLGRFPTLGIIKTKLLQEAA